MGRVRYARSALDLERVETAGQDGGELRYRLLHAVYESDAEVVQAVVPRPLEPLVQPELRLAFLETTRIDPAGHSRVARAAVFGVHVEYDGLRGCYPITMPTAPEQAVLAGRERFGEPRKLAEVVLEVEADRGRVAASATRHGVRFLAATGEREVELEPAEEIERLFCFKAFPDAVSGAALDGDPRLVRIERRRRPQRRWAMRGGLELGESLFDPVADLPVRRLVAFEYEEGRLVVTARDLRPVPTAWLRPFLHQRYDAPEVVGVEV